MVCQTHDGGDHDQVRGDAPEAQPDHAADTRGSAVFVSSPYCLADLEQDHCHRLQNSLKNKHVRSNVPKHLVPIQRLQHRNSNSKIIRRRRQEPEDRCCEQALPLASSPLVCQIGAQEGDHEDGKLADVACCYNSPVQGRQVGCSNHLKNQQRQSHPRNIEGQRTEVSSLRVHQTEPNGHEPERKRRASLQQDVRQIHKRIPAFTRDGRGRGGGGARADEGSCCPEPKT
mmetsp:Transcript_32199/g.83523  ORF Transcript_32199/g.83523 Transcript_32199/m.83523 type:complete len:229 (-) Transcript_32199:24-710(-)